MTSVGSSTSSYAATGVSKSRGLARPLAPIGPRSGRRKQARHNSRRHSRARRLRCSSTRKRTPRGISAICSGAISMQAELGDDAESRPAGARSAVSPSDEKKTRRSIDRVTAYMWMRAAGAPRDIAIAAVGDEAVDEIDRARRGGEEGPSAGGWARAGPRRTGAERSSVVGRHRGRRHHGWRSGGGGRAMSGGFPRGGR